FADFVRDADGWGFTRDRRLGFRMIDPRPSEPLKRTWNGELWELMPERKRLWRVDLPPLLEHATLSLVDFFSKDGRSLVVISPGWVDAYLLDRRDGSLVDQFAFGHLRADEGVLPSKRDFVAYELSIEPSRRLLACGEFEGRRVRVVSLDPPFKTVFTAHS